MTKYNVGDEFIPNYNNNGYKLVICQNLFDIFTEEIIYKQNLCNIKTNEVLYEGVKWGEKIFDIHIESRGYYLKKALTKPLEYYM